LKWAPDKEKKENESRGSITKFAIGCGGAEEAGRQGRKKEKNEGVEYCAKQGLNPNIKSISFNGATKRTRIKELGGGHRENERVDSCPSLIQGNAILNRENQLSR